MTSFRNFKFRFFQAITRIRLIEPFSTDNRINVKCGLFDKPFCFESYFLNIIVPSIQFMFYSKRLIDKSSCADLIQNIVLDFGKWGDSH